MWNVYDNFFLIVIVIIGIVLPIQSNNKDTKIEPKEIKPSIYLSASLPLKGNASIIGASVADGMNLIFNKIQKEPQAWAYSYNLETLDDLGILQKTNANIVVLKKKSPIFMSMLGDEVFDIIAPLLKNNEIISLFPIDGIDDHRVQPTTNTVFFRASYAVELEALTDYVVNKLYKKKIAIMYEASDEGIKIKDTFKKILAKKKITLLAEASYPEKTLNTEFAAQEIAKKGPNVVLCVASARAAYSFIKQIINKGLFKTTILGLSPLMSIQKTLKVSRGIRIITSSVVPNPKKSLLPIAEEYRNDMKKYLGNKELSIFSFEGYINALLLVECSKLIQPPVTKEKLIIALQALKNVSFKGIPLYFDSITNPLCHCVWINTGDKQEKTWPLFDQQHYRIREQNGEKSKATNT